MSRPLIVLFGGQSSRDIRMFDRLEAADPDAGARARERAARYGGGDPTVFDTNRTIQTSVLAVTLGWLEVLAAHGLRSTASAGLSLGEYAHLVDVGALEAEDALALVRTRGDLYDRGPEGAMAAIFPTAWEELAPLVARIAAAHGGVAALAPAVFSSPTQTVVAGSRTAVSELIEAAEAQLYASGVVVEDRIPMHTPRFRAVAVAFGEALGEAPWTGRARHSYRPNVVGTARAADTGALVECLSRHVHEPVLWRQTVDALADEYPDGVFLEAGPRAVVRDLMRRRWHERREVFAVDDPDASTPSDVRERVTATLTEVLRTLTRAGTSAETRSTPSGDPASVASATSASR